VVDRRRIAGEAFERVRLPVGGGWDLGVGQLASCTFAP
jgi:hypothetical protein